MSGLEKEFDTYIKKTIKNTTINYVLYEKRQREKEVLMSELEDKELLVNSLSFFDVINLNSIEEYVENPRLAEILKQLSNKQKQIIKLSIVEQYNSKEIGKVMKLSDSRIRHILKDTLEEIKKKMKEE